MKSFIKKIGMLVTMLSTFVSASAYDFIVDGIAYTITSFSDFECTVSSADVSYEGDIAIPAEVNYNGKRLTVVSIEDAAFENSAITSVILPESLNRIGEKSFKNCNSLHTVSLNEGLQSIGIEAFSKCVLLQSIQFPQTLQSIETSSFEQCTSLEVVVFPQALTTLGGSSFKNCSNLREVIFTNLSTLEANTFNGCRNLKSISWSDNIQQIKDYAFADCGFETFCIPNSVTKIGTSILSGNQNLRSFTIGNGLSKISSDPIEGCSNVKELIIADGTKSLCLDFSKGSYQIIESDQSTASNEYWKNKYYYIRPAAYSSSSFDYVYIGRSLDDPSYTKQTGQSGPHYDYWYYYYSLPPFYGNKNIKTVEIGPNVSSLYSVMFSCKHNSYSYGWLEDCTNLENLRIAGLSNIPELFARNATSLKSVELSNSTTLIGGRAFSGCISLETIVLGAKISSIEGNAFSNCSSLTSIYCKPKTPPAYKTGFSKDLYLNCNLYIPFETEESYKQCSPWNNFWNTSESSECISDFTCGNLTYSVTSGDNVTIIGNNITEQCDLKIPTHVEYFSKEYNVVGINEKAFWTSLLSSIIIPESITYIYNDAFYNCRGLKSIEFEYGETPLFIGCNSSLHLSRSITPFPNPSNVDERRTGFRNGYYDGLFYGLPIEHLVINRDIELPKYYERTMGSSTSSYSTVYNDIIYYPPFYGLMNLKTIEIGENVCAICKNQIEAVVNAVPVTMDYTNFGKCDNIEVVVSNNPNAPIGGGFTQSVYENASLFLPNGGVVSYKEDDYWKNFSNMSETPFIAIESISFESDEIVSDINESRNLLPILNPKDASIKKLSWSSSTPSIVQVSDEGIITTSTREGEATITATACDGSGVSASIKIIVQKGTGINSIYNNTKPIIYVKSGKLYISGKSESETVEIYNIQGQLIESSKDSVIDLKSHGIYIVKIGTISRTVTL